METPSSNRRVTRSQAMAVLNSASANSNIPSSKKVDDSEKGKSKLRQRNGGGNQDRSALIDITNDSPIVGLAKGSVGTPLSSISKKRSIMYKNTPGSGEALLRGQVKTLLQKVEEDSEIPKFSFESKSRYGNLRGFIDSPARLLAPTPANTPQVLNFSCNGDDEELSRGFAAEYPVEDQLKISQVVNEIFDGKATTNIELGKDIITRSLLFDFSDKSESPNSLSSGGSSVLTYQSKEPAKSENKDASLTEDDDSSIWSIQVNASMRDDEVEDGEVYDLEEQGIEDDGYDVEDEGSCYAASDEYLDELCDGMSQMNVEDKEVVNFMGKHVRFLYNSDDEIIEEVEDDCAAAVGTSETDEKDFARDILRLKGLPTPKGKHLRFLTAEDEEGRQEEDSTGDVLRLKGVPTPKGKHLRFLTAEEEEGRQEEDSTGNVLSLKGVPTPNGKEEGSP